MIRGGGIVLVGPPGSGKTAVGNALGDLGYWFEDREAALLSRYGSIDEFRRQREQAVARLHEDFVTAIERETRPWVYESTALTERDWVAGLGRDYAGFAVRLDVSLETALARVSSRAAGGNLSNEAAAVERVWRACTEAYEAIRFDLVVGTESLSPDEVAKAIDAAFRAARLRL